MYSNEDPPQPKNKINKSLKKITHFAINIIIEERRISDKRGDEPQDNGCALNTQIFYFSVLASVAI